MLLKDRVRTTPLDGPSAKLQIPRLIAPSSLLISTPQKRNKSKTSKLIRKYFDLLITKLSTRNSRANWRNQSRAVSQENLLPQ